MVPFLLPCLEASGFFPQLHGDNLVGLLEVNSRKVRGCPRTGSPGFKKSQLRLHTLRLQHLLRPVSCSYASLAPVAASAPGKLCFSAFPVSADFGVSICPVTSVLPWI